MKREQAKKWLPEIIHWANGGNLWTYDEEWLEIKALMIDSLIASDIIVIEDKHFEARKAFALGKPIEIKCGVTTPWVKVYTPSWDKECDFRPKPKEWYDEVSEDTPVLCWVRGERGKTIPAAIYKYENHLFYDTDSFRWMFAEPIKPEECWKETK